MRKLSKILPLYLLLFLIIGCNGVETPSETQSSIIDFTEDLTTNVETTTEETSTSVLSAQLNYIYNLAVDSGNFDGTYEEWLESVQGPQGEPGREISLQVSQGYIQWQYAGESVWNNLIEISSLIGPQGPSGDNGESIEFNVSDTHIEYKYESDSEWTQLIALSLFEGEQGMPGKEIVLQNIDGIVQWQYVGDDEWYTLIDINHLMSPRILLNVSDTHIQYKYEGEAEWIDLISLELLTGDSGKEVTLEVDETYIKWQYTGEDTWNNLISLSLLKGEQGEKGSTPYIGDNGNWWIDEEDTGFYAGEHENMDRIGTDGLYFDLTVKNGIAGYEVSNYTGSETDIIIPNKVFGQKVISIKQGALPAYMTSLSISKFTEKIPSFEDYAYLKSFDFNSAPVTYIPYNGFKDAVNLETISNYENIRVISDNAFYNTKILFTGFDYSYVESIGDYAFYNTSSSNIEIDSGLMVSETNDSIEFSNITFLFIPDNVTSIGEHAFPSDFSIYYEGDATVDFGYNNPYFFKNVKKSEDGYWYIDKTTYVSILNYTGELDQITIPSEIDGKSVNSIENYAFVGDNHLSRVNIPSSVTSIGNGSFRYTRKLYVLHIPSSIINISNSFFGQYESELDFYNFPASVKVFENNLVDMNINQYGLEEYEWGRYAFGYSSEDIKMDDDFVYIENLTTTEIIAFKNASGKVTVPSTYNEKPITRIHPNAFLHRNGGIKFVDISEGVLYISTSAFISNYIQYINIPLSVSAVNYRAFYTSNAYIYVKASSKPANWDSSWYYDAEEIIWGENLDAMLSDDLYMYEIISGKAWIKKYLGTWSYSSALILPDEIDGYEVVGIRANAIRYTSSSYSYRHEIVIPNTITHIEENGIIYYRYLDVYTTFSSRPSNWHQYFGYGTSYGSSESYRTYYWNGEWNYVNSEPTPIN
jgi:hypothetical protein